MSTKLIEAIRKEIRDYPPVAYLLLIDFLDILKQREERIKAEDARRKSAGKWKGRNSAKF